MGFRRIAIVMAGGSGTRFWPVSTPERPKQFLRLAHPDKSLLQESVERIEPLVGEDVFISTASSMVSASRTECPQLKSDNFLGEPHKRNTFGALVWTTAHFIATTEDWEQTSIAVLTADHLIRPAEKFRDTVEQAMALAEERQTLVTIGIRPTRPATEYGYVKVGDRIKDGAWSAQTFTEKPDAGSATNFISLGNYFWNSGMFFWTLGAFHDQVKKHLPEQALVMTEIAGLLSKDRGDQAADKFAELTDISIDYALMERADKVDLVEAKFEWDDLGSWDALSRCAGQGTDNTTVGATNIIDSQECVVYNDSEAITVNLLGMDNVVVVVTDKDVMVCPKSRAQDVKKFSD